ncbi:MAG: uroporphyrinogen-III synthase [Mangrovicoccus sp.]|nr:uroporphyrinogen-III synthase [Mangrovicoccus sp.]
MPQPRLLLSRPRAQSLEFAAAVKARFGEDFDPVIAPVFEIVFRPLQANPAEFDGWVFTSRNGVAGFVQASAHRNRRAWCVGDATAQAARAAGMAAQSAGGALPDLARLLADLSTQTRLLHLCGAHQAGDLAAMLGPYGPQLTRQVIYDQEAQPISAQAQALLAGSAPVIAPVFSPRSARLLAPAFEQARAPLCLAAMSPAVASALPVQAAWEIVIAPQADAPGMLEAMGKLLSMGKFA